MKYSEKIFTLFSFILIALGGSNVVGLFLQNGLINMVYTIYLAFGLIACFFTYKSTSLGFLLFVVFYAVQTVRIFSPEFNYNFTTGLSFFFTYHDGDRYTPMVERSGFAINLLSIGMLIFSIVILVRKRLPKPIGEAL